MAEGTTACWQSRGRSEDVYVAALQHLSDMAKASGRTYLTCSSVILGLMVMSYFGRVTERCSRTLYCFISLAATRTPSGYSPWSRFTVGCNPFQVIRRAHCRTTFSPFSNTPFHFFSNVDQHRSIRLYLLWYGG